ncbi:MAG: CDP-alcohol phosphatidyltransferase family protein [Bacilli bacterium]|nr:CDP-alcohol phosphatidyltransferase family protein [Bacilli bacterium]
MIKKYFSNYKEEFKQAIDDLKHKDTFYKQIPNILTFMRLVLAIPAGILYYFNPIVSILSIAFLWLTDAVDGPIARKLDIQSKLGADMDTVADKIMFLASSIPLLGSIPFLSLNLLLEGVIASINVGGRLKGLDTRTVFSGKLKTVSMGITLVYGYLFQFFGFPNLIKVILIGITSFLQTLAINDYVEELDRLNNEQKVNAENNQLNNEVESDNNSEKINKIEELKKIKSFVLASQLPNKVYAGKKRARMMMQEKKNN